MSAQQNTENLHLQLILIYHCFLRTIKLQVTRTIKRPRYCSLIFVFFDDKRLILVFLLINLRSLSLRRTSGGNLLSELNLLNPKWTVLVFIVCTLGFKRQRGAPRCLFLIWVLSISAAKAIIWKNCCFEWDKGVGTHQWTFKECSSGWTEQTSANMNGSASDFKHLTITKLVGLMRLKSEMILQQSLFRARFKALSLDTLSIIATSSGVYSLT